MFPIRHDEAMDDAWTQLPVAEVRPGDRIRANGQEVLVARIEPDFFGVDGLVAFIEDSPDRWFKMPLPTNLVVEAQRPA